MNKKESLAAERRLKTTLSVVLGAICIIYVLPVLTVVINSFKLNTYVKTDTFALPRGEKWAGFSNFIKGMTFGNYPFWNSVKYSVLITVVSTALILVFCSMAAWYIARVNSFFCKAIYYLCVFSMVVPFQMGHVHPLQDGGLPPPEHPMDHPRRLPRLWRGPRDLHVRRLCEVDPA